MLRTLVPKDFRRTEAMLVPGSASPQASAGKRQARAYLFFATFLTVFFTAFLAFFTTFLAGFFTAFFTAFLIVAIRSNLLR